jgi:hypothetical protein
MYILYASYFWQADLIDLDRTAVADWYY